MNVYFENNGDKIGEVIIIDGWHSEKREHIRKGLQRTFKFLHKEVKVRFQDECAECNWPFIRGRCHNEWCIINLPDDEENVVDTPDITQQLNEMRREFDGL